jgi:hypothetical protein
MLQHPAAIQIYERLVQVPSAWFESVEGRRLTARALQAVRNIAGPQEAATLRDLLTVCKAVPIEL